MKQLLGVLLIVGFVGAYWGWILAAVVVAAVVVSGLHWWANECEHVERLEAQRRAVAARADQQHAWTMQGDPRGTYGRYTPATI